MEDQTLLSGIIKQAEEEGREIIRQAEDTIAARNRGWEVSQKDIIRESERGIAEKLEDIQRQTQSAVESERRRRLLALREETRQAAISAVYRKAEGITGHPGYTRYMACLLAEGVIAVNSSTVKAACSFRETLSKDMLAQAAAIVKEHTGKDVTILPDTETSFAHQGVFVSSEDGRIKYDNRLPARLRRFDAEIKNIIFSELKNQENKGEDSP